MYQSYKVLSGPSPNVRPHDFMDDLESFFYVLCHVTFLYNPGRPMKSVSSHEILRPWMFSPEVAAGMKFMFAAVPGLPSNVTFENLGTKTVDVVYNMLTSLCAFFSPHHYTIAAALTNVRSSSAKPMHRLGSRKEYMTVAKDAYDSFLLPVNGAIEELQQLYPDWNSELPLPSRDSRASEVDSGRSSPASLSAPDDGPRAGSSLSLPLSLPPDSSTHTSRSSSKRPRSPVSDEPASIEHESAGSDTRSGRATMRTKGSAR